MLCVAALVLLLPHSSSKGVLGQQGTQPQNASNITSPLTTVGPTSALNKSITSTTTITSAASNQSNSTQYGISNSTTILYVYCVGSPTPPFNQSYYAQLDSTGAENWKSSSSYPVPFLDGSCASNGADIYCVGGSELLPGAQLEQAYYAPVAQGGLGAWLQTSSYPVPFSSGSCTASNGYVYCVGTMNSSDSKDTFYASASSSGLGAWAASTPYPAPFYGGQCNAYNGYIYCMGDTYLNLSASAAYYKSIANTVAGKQQLASGNLPLMNASEDFYAPISPSGIGAWKRISSTPQPVDGGSCSIADSTIFCIGGSSAAAASSSATANYTAFNSMVNATAYVSSLYGNDSSAAFYAPIGANGAVGQWQYTAPYLDLLQGTQCATNSSNIYCIGGINDPQQVVYSPLSPNSGVSDWIPTTEYPIPFYSGYCSTNKQA